MVMHARAIAVAAAGLAVLLAGSTCKVLNEEHCANQDVPGNEFCRELNSATPYCSPCRREFFGCVDFEPFACAGYAREIGEDEDGSSGSGTGEGSSGSDGSSSSG